MSRLIRQKVLVLGASGMLGNAILRYFAAQDAYSVNGTVRSGAVIAHLHENVRDRVIAGVDVENMDVVSQLLDSLRPDVVVNCIGIVKQLKECNDPLRAIPINALLPHRLARLCNLARMRLIHISTDCVFSGSRGQYSERDTPDAQDLYGRSKHLGEVASSGAVTLRTSVIGHEIFGRRGLINWFLSQDREVKGYTRAIFTGLPTVELARVIRDFVLPNAHVHGLYHVASDPISKFELLQLVAKIYEKSVTITPDESVVIDRS